MNATEMSNFARSFDLEKAYDFAKVFTERIIEEETARGNMKKIIMCMTETQFCQLICNHPLVGNALCVKLMRRVYQAINQHYDNKLAELVRNSPAKALNRNGINQANPLN